MRILRIACVVVFVLISAREAKIEMNAPATDSASERSNGVATGPQQPFPVCSIFFLKDKFVTTEGDPFVIAVEADCPPGAPTDAKFEFLQPPPRFVAFSYVYRSEVSALKLIAVQPQRGDAGNYFITFSVTHCTGGAGCGFRSFKLKVKPPQ